MEQSQFGFIDDRICSIVPVGKRRDGGTRYWCMTHSANATAKYGKPASKCRYADIPPITEEETLNLKIGEYPGGVALWGAVPPIFDTTRLPMDKGIHVHARKVPGGGKDIDRTYRRIRVVHDDASLEVSELDAIYFMVSSIFGYRTKSITCPRCRYSHLDRDWFSVHPHQSHLCAGCGKNFRDKETSVGNPVAAMRALPFAQVSNIDPSKKALMIRQKDFEGGLQIWGSNPAILWTAQTAQASGIHIHAFKSDKRTPDIDDTFSSVVVDGIELDEEQVRTFMAQSSLPHLAGRVCAVVCTECGCESFDSGYSAVELRVQRECSQCGSTLRVNGRLKKVVSNPILTTIERLCEFSLRRPQIHNLGLLSETL